MNATIAPRKKLKDNVPTKLIVEHVALFTRWCVRNSIQFMWETLKNTLKKEWSNISKMWHKKYSTIKILILLQQKWSEIIKFEILSKVNPVGLIKTWSKSSCNLCMKEILEIVSRSQSRYRKLINACSEINRAYRHNLRFHRFNWH